MSIAEGDWKGALVAGAGMLFGGAVLAHKFINVRKTLFSKEILNARNVTGPEMNPLTARLVQRSYLGPKTIKSSTKGWDYTFSRSGLRNMRTKSGRRLSNNDHVNFERLAPGAEFKTNQKNNKNRLLNYHVKTTRYWSIW